MKPRIIIGIAGKKGSGKDTAASMIAHIIRNGTASNYNKWIVEKDSLDPYNDIHVAHFADSMKNILSTFYCIPINCFYDNKYKEDLYYCFDSKIFINKTTAERQSYFIIEHIHLSDNTLAEVSTRNNKKTCIKLRTLMQYFGTNVIRQQLGDYVWCNACITDAITKLNYQYNEDSDVAFVLIPDVRFNNEAEAILNIDGHIIQIDRDACKTDSHISEDIRITANKTVIENNSSLLNLYYKLKQHILKNIY